MKKIADFIVKQKIYFLSAFLVIMLICGVLQSGVKTNYMLSDYLPKDNEFAKAFEINGENFGTNENIKVMVKDIDEAELQNRLTEINSVENVDSAVINQYKIEYKAALIDVVIKQNVSYDEIKKLVADIEATGDNQIFISGNIINIINQQDIMNGEIAKILFLLIPFALLIMIITSKSFFEPVLCMATILAAILISMGTNIIFADGISFITKSMLTALTMAVSIDYSIFLIHAYKAERVKGEDVNRAVANSIVSSFRTITVGSLTTVAGFSAMLIMKFALGYDIGMVFAKTILIALITVLLFMPTLILIFHKLIDKTEHRNLLPSFKGVGKFAVKFKEVIAIIIILILVPSVYGQFNNNFTYGMGDFEKSKGYIAKQEILNTFNGGNQTILLIENRQNLAEEKALFDEISAIEYNGRKITKDGSTSYADLINILWIQGQTAFVSLSIPDNTGLDDFEAIISNPQSQFMQTLTYLATNPNPNQQEMAGLYSAIMQITMSKSAFVTENYSRFILQLDLKEEGAETFAVLDIIKEKANSDFENENYILSQSMALYGIKQAVQTDYILVTVLALIAIFIIVAVSFKSIVLSLILLFVIEAGIFITMAIPFFLGQTIVYIGYLMISAVQLGCTIDYAILLTDKYKHYRKEMTAKEAAIESVEASAPSILTSGGILSVVGLVLNLISTDLVISQIGGIVFRAGLISMLLVFTLLPGLLVIFDKYITKNKKIVIKQS